MLETSQERVRLLKAGIDGKTIEKLYIIYNNFKIMQIPILFVDDVRKISQAAQVPRRSRSSSRHGALRHQSG